MAGRVVVVAVVMMVGVQVARVEVDWEAGAVLLVVTGWEAVGMVAMDKVVAVVGKVAMGCVMMAAMVVAG